jgi:hypothetical protein
VRVLIVSKEVEVGELAGREDSDGKMCDEVELMTPIVAVGHSPKPDKDGLDPACDEKDTADSTREDDVEPAGIVGVVSKGEGDADWTTEAEPSELRITDCRDIVGSVVDPDAGELGSLLAEDGTGNIELKIGTPIELIDSVEEASNIVADEG